MQSGNTPKLIAQYFLRRAHDSDAALTPMQVLKLVYIAHGWYLALNFKPLVNEDIQAWQYGPVIPSRYHEYKSFGGRALTSVPDMYPLIEPSEATVMDEVWEGYGRRSGPSLSTLTHEPGSPWETTVRESGIGAVISNDLIQDFYRRLATR